MATANPSLRDFISLRYSFGGRWITSVASQRVGAVLAWLALKAGLTPSAVTVLALVTACGGAWLLDVSPHGAVWWIPCGMVLQLSYALDCADGQLARGTGQASPFGAWLDVTCDHLRHVVLAGAATDLMLRDNLRQGIVLAAVGLFLGGAIVVLHTSTQLRSPGDTSEKLADRLHVVRLVLTNATDTPVTLVVLVVLRDHAALLAAYMGLLGLYSLLAAGYIALGRLSRPGN